MTNSVKTSLSLLVALAALVCTPLAAAAHPVVREGRRLAQEASFDEALAAFARAEASGDLGRDDLIELFEGRALVHFAQGDRAALHADVAVLAALAPERPPARDLPPDLVSVLREAVRASPGPVSVRATATRRGEIVRVESTVEHVPSGLAVHVRVAARVASAALSVVEGAARDVSAPGGARVAYYMELVGPGGAVIATDGSVERPHVVEALGAPREVATTAIPATTATTAEPGSTETHADSGALASTARTAPTAPTEPMQSTPPTEPSEGTPVWPFVVGGGVLVVGAIVAIILAVTLSGSSTTASLPSLPSGLP
jgi:hypothetical protein